MSDRLVTVATFDQPVQAEMARDFLENEGIPAILFDESAVATDWLLSNAIGGIKLQVPLPHLERAEFLLSRTRQNDPPTEADTDESAFASSEHAASLRARQQEIEEEQRAEEIDRTPCNQLADRLLRTTILGFLFIPLQFYAIYLLLLAFSELREISRDRRWKIWLSLLMNIPIMGSLLMLLACLTRAA